MFLSFRKKSPPTKTHGSLEESPKVTRALVTDSTVDAVNGSSRSTVQTTAGPLLSSSRFNSILDASTFANVNSPGFTSRVVNCATGGSSSHLENSATHHSKYSSVGLFPRVQLGAQSILPTLSPRNSQKVGRTPVRVRIASPSLNERRRHSISGGSSEAVADRTVLLKRSPSLSNGVAAESPHATNISENDSSTVENSQELSRKRMFSECQDPCDESKKRRRKAEMPIPNPNNDMYRYRHVRVPAVPTSLLPTDMSSQGKRAREKGSPEEQKRQRRRTCSSNNAIFSSLSSSRNLLERLTAFKRKSVDFSRSSSPLPPLSGKQVKESKTIMDVKATQCNLAFAHTELRTFANSSQQDNSPISSRVIIRRTDSNLKEALEKPLEKSSNESLTTSNCDYTTKLFRKDIPSHSLRASTSKAQKQSPWVQAPAADELTCLLLSEDSKVDRPERLKSLLACVSGKVDSKNEDTKKVTAASGVAKEINVSKPGVVLPVISSSCSSMKALSPTGGSLSTAVTVTVSSTCTIMTSSTVTVVNGVPSSESGRIPPPCPVSSQHVQSLLPSSKPTTATASENNMSSVGSAGTRQPDLSLNAVISTSSLMKHPSSTPNVDHVNDLHQGTNVITTEQVPDCLNKGRVSNSGTALQFSQSGFSQASLNSFTMTSPVTNSQISMGTVSVSADQTPKLAFQFGTSSSNSTTSAIMTFGSNVQPPSTPVNVSVSLPQPATGSSAVPVLSFGSTLSATKTISFGSNGSACPEVSASAPSKTFSFGSNGSASPKVSSSAPSKTFSFGSNGSAYSEVPSSAPSKTFSFGFNESASSEVPASALSKTFSFGSNGSKSSEALASETSGMPKPSLSFGSSLGVSTASSATSKPGFQFGSGGSTHQVSSQFGPSSTDTSKPALHFGLIKTSNNSSPGSTNPVLQFGSNGTEATETSKQAFQFGPSSSNGLSVPTKSTFKFTSNDSGLSDTSKSMPQFGSSFQSSAGTQKPALSFGSASGGMNATSQSSFHSGTSKSQIGSSNPAFQLGANINNIPAGSTPFQFGSNVDSASDAGKSSFQFGSSLNKPMNSSTSNFQLGSILNKPNDSSKANSQSSASFNSTPTFGSTTQEARSAFGQVVPSNSKGAFTFGSSDNVNLGNENKGMFFGSSGAMPINSGPGHSTLFSSGTSSSAFGAPSMATHSTTFSAASNAKSPEFGSTSFGGTDPSSFSLNSNGPTGGRVNNAFQFGSATANGGNAGSFSFGQKQDQVPAGFSFNATVTTVPSPATLSSQAPGLFSIGSGPSTGQRRTTTARRRR